MRKKVLKGITSLLLLVSFLISVFPAYSADDNSHGMCGPALYWEYDSKGKTLTVSGEGPMYNYRSKYSKFAVAPWVLYSDIERVIIEEGCTRIGDYAFSFLSSARSIVFPENSLTEIGEYAFYRCHSLTRAVIPDSVERIGASAFLECILLVYIDFGNGISEVATDMCYGAQQLRTVKLGENCKKLGVNSFYECVNLFDIDLSTVSEISTQCFYGCKKLSRAHMGKDFKVMGPNAFGYCESLNEIIFDVPPVDIDCSYDTGTPGYNERKKGFYTICDGKVLLVKDGKSLSMTSYEVPEGVRVLGGSLFSSVASLTKVTVPDGVESIGRRAFSDSSTLRSISLPETVNYIGAQAFGYYSWTGKFDYLKNITVTCRGCSPDLYEYCVASGVTLKSEHYFERAVISSSCESGTYTADKCRKCSCLANMSFEESAGHSFTLVETSPTCTQGAVKKKVCDVCGESEILSVSPPEGHVVSDEWTLVIEPTCSEKGCIAKLCVKCGEATGELEIEKNAHKASDSPCVIVKATCTEAGLFGYTCVLCGEHLDVSEITPEGHCFGEYTDIACDELYGTVFKIRICGECNTAEGKWFFDKTDIEADKGTAAGSEINCLSKAFAQSTGGTYVFFDRNGDGIISASDMKCLKTSALSCADLTGGEK